jgi:hypothetical protein
MSEYDDISKKIDEAKEEAKRTGKPVIAAVQESDYSSCKGKIPELQQLGRQLRGRTSIFVPIDDQGFVRGQS